MDLSVIIPVYNAGALINRCLDSIFSQQGQYEIEVICIDDGSTDAKTSKGAGARKESNFGNILPGNAILFQFVVNEFL